MPAETEWTVLFAAGRRKIGLDLNLYKQEQLRRRILGSCDSKGLAGLGELSKLIEADDAACKWLIDRLAINVSELYRNPEKWVELETKVLGPMIRPGRRLKIWSAGCSFGAEAHTIACLLESRFPGAHTVLGTDIDAAALDQARQGSFSDADMRGVPSAVRNRYFTKANDRWTASAEIRKYLTFKRGDLLSDKFDTGYDLILCRNVVIYFTEEAKDLLYARFFHALKPGGVLFVGGTERIFNSRQIGFEAPIPFFYQKPLEEENRWRNAS
jgi:chemotaxis protein methyltransferase CheR